MRKRKAIRASASACEAASCPCGIYSSTTQPVARATATTIRKMVVLDAAIGWKQPNGFYYPPAFTLPAQRVPEEPLGRPQQCLTSRHRQCRRQRQGDFVKLTAHGSCRHDASIARCTYIQGNMAASTSASRSASGPEQTELGVSPIDFATILVDLDGA